MSGVCPRKASFHLHHHANKQISKKNKGKEALNSHVLAVSQTESAQESDRHGSQESGWGVHSELPKLQPGTSYRKSKSKSITGQHTIKIARV